MTRFRALLWKEWIALRPFSVLLGVLFCIGLVATFATEFVDQKPFWSTCVVGHGNITWVTFVLCVVVSLGLLVREKDEGTLTYLDALPVSRSEVFLAKWIMALISINALNLLWFGEALIYEFISRTSDAPELPWRSVGMVMFLTFFQSAFFITILVALSFLRRWALLALAMLYWLLTGLKNFQVPYAELLDPFMLIEPPEDPEDVWVLPKTQLIVLSVVGAGAWMFAYGVFSIRGGGISKTLKQFLESWFGKLVWGSALVLIPVVWLIIIAFSLDEKDDAEAYGSRPSPRQVSGKDEILTAETERFHFVYRRKSENRMKAVLEKADETFDEVAEFLRFPESMQGEKITVDLSSPLASHNAGQAFWKKIRMLPPQKGQSTKETIAILGHEVTHVLIDQMTEGRLEESFDAARWFHEGLASYVEFRFFRPPHAGHGYERWVALASTWGEVHFSEMVENGTFSALRDPFLAYPAGYVWVEALVDVYGDEAPMKILMAIGRPDGPRKLSGMALWRDACLAADFDLERVRTRFRARLKELRGEHEERCGSYVELVDAEAERKGGRVIIRPEFPDDWDEERNGELICRVRPRTQSAPLEWRYSRIKDGRPFSVPAISFLGAELEAQIGWDTKNWAKQPVFGEWMTLKLEKEKDGKEPQAEEAREDTEGKGKRR